MLLNVINALLATFVLQALINLTYAQMDTTVKNLLRISSISLAKMALIVYNKDSTHLPNVNPAPKVISANNQTFSLKNALKVLITINLELLLQMILL